MKRRLGIDEVLAYQKEHNQSWIYLNKEDKNIIVPRNEGFLPWTMNVAHPITWLVLGIIIFMVVVSFVLNIK